MKVIDHLTDEQEAEAQRQLRAWRQQSLSTTVDKAGAEKAVAEFYKMCGLKEPLVLWCASPIQLVSLPLSLMLLCPREGKEISTNIPTLRSNWQNRFAECFEPEVANSVSGSLWEAASRTSEVIIKTKRLLQFRPIDFPKRPGFRTSSQIGRHSREATPVGDLEEVLKPLTAKMFSLASARVERSIAQRLRNQLGTDRLTFAFRHRTNAHGHRVMQQVRNATAHVFCNTKTVSAEARAVLFKLWWGMWDHESFLYYQYLRSYLTPDIFDAETDQKFGVWLDLTRSAIAFQFFNDVCFVSENPTFIAVDDVIRPHHDSAPAIKFSDGFEVCAWHGVRVPPYVVKERSKITVADIETERNVEVRRAKMMQFGADEYIAQSAAEIVDSSTYGTLYRKQIPNDEPLVMVKVINSTPEPDGSFKEYFLRVPPHFTTARAAVAWTFGLQEEDYDVAGES